MSIFSRGEPYGPPRTANTGSEFEGASVSPERHVAHIKPVEETLASRRALEAQVEVDPNPARRALRSAAAELSQFDTTHATHSPAEAIVRSMPDVEVHARHEGGFEAPPMAESILGSKITGRKLTLFVSDKSGTVDSDQFVQLMKGIQRELGDRVRSAAEREPVNSYRSGVIICLPQSQGELFTTVRVFQNKEQAQKESQLKAGE